MFYDIQLIIHYLADMIGVDTHTTPSRFYVDKEKPRPVSRLVPGLQRKDSFVNRLPTKWTGGEVLPEHIVNFHFVSIKSIFQLNPVVWILPGVVRLLMKLHTFVLRVTLLLVAIQCLACLFGRMRKKKSFSWLPWTTTTI